MTSAAIADILLNVKRRRFLAPFFGRTRTVREAAAELGVKPNSLLYQVKRLVALGLLEVVSVESRAGRAIRHYRATSERFFVPFAASSAETMEALVFETAAPYSEQFARYFARALQSMPGGVVGYLVGRHKHGEVDAYFSPDGIETLSLWASDAPAAGRAWTVLELDHEEAKAFQHELWGLWQRYLGRRGSGRYLAHFDLVPIFEG